MRGVAFSLFLHLAMIVLMSDIVIHYTSDKDSTKTTSDDASIVKLQLGNLAALDNTDYDYSENALETNAGLDDANYGRIVSQIVLKHFNNSNIMLVGNRADIRIKLSKSGKVISSTVLLQSNDYALYRKITAALQSSDLAFPRNHKAKGNLTYRLSLF